MQKKTLVNLKHSNRNYPKRSNHHKNIIILSILLLDLYLKVMKAVHTKMCTGIFMFYM